MATQKEIEATARALKVTLDEAWRILADGLHKEILKRDRPAEELKKVIKELREQ